MHIPTSWKKSKGLWWEVVVCSSAPFSIYYLQFCLSLIITGWFVFVKACLVGGDLTVVLPVLGDLTGGDQTVACLVGGDLTGLSSDIWSMMMYMQASGGRVFKHADVFG